MTEKETKKTVKKIIIGFGKGGKTLAKFLGQQGEEVLLVEKSAKMYGGYLHQHRLPAVQAPDFGRGSR